MAHAAVGNLSAFRLYNCSDKRPAPYPVPRFSLLLLKAPLLLLLLRQEN
jgi:hypothetical protein